MRQANIDFVMSVRLSVHMRQPDSHRTDFHEILYLSIFRKSVEKIKVWLKSGENNRYSTQRRFHIPDNISLIFSQNKKRLRQNLYIQWNHTFRVKLFFRKSWRLWDNVETYDRARQAAWCQYNIAHALCMLDNWCFLLFHCNNGYANAPHCNVIRKLAVLCIIIICL